MAPAGGPAATPEAPRQPFTWPLFAPGPAFRAVGAALSPVWPLRHLVAPLALLATVIIAFNWYEFLAHVERVIVTLGFWQKILISMLTANLISKLITGITMSRLGADPPAFGVRLLFGLLPKFYVDRRPTKLLTLDAQRRCYAAPLMTKLALYAVGIFCWSMLHRTGSGAADMFLAIGVTGLGAFLFTANPLLPMDGCRWLSARVRRPRLRAHSFRLTYLLATGRKVPEGIDPREGAAMVLYAVAALAFTAFLLFFIVSTVAIALESQFEGSGVVMLCLMVAMVTYFWLSVRAFREGGNGSRSRPRPAAATAPAAASRAVLSDPAAGVRPATNDPAGDGPRSMPESPRPTLSLLKRRAGNRDAAQPMRGGAASAAVRSQTAPPPAPAAPQAEAAPAPPSPRAEEADDYLDALDALLDFGVDEEDEEPEEDDVLGSLVSDRPGARAAPAAPDPDLDDLLGVPAAPPAVEDHSPATGAESAAPDGPAPAPAAGDAAPAAPAGEGDARNGPKRPEARAEAPPRRRWPSLGRRGARDDGAAGAPPGRDDDDLDRVLQVGRHRRKPPPRWRKWAIWLAVLAALAFVLTRPYPFEVGGEFIVQPLDRAEVRARTDGEITELRVAEGDWVEAGQIMAVLSNWDEQRDIAVRQAELASLRARLETLKAGATPEEIAVAEEKLRTARIRHEIAEAEFQQQQQLFDAGTITGRALQDARAELRLAQANMAEAEAALRLTRADATEPEIASAHAEIARNEEDLAYARLKLEQTNIRATIGGQIVSTMAAVPVGAFLPEGGLFAQLQDNRSVIAEIKVPETTIEEVELGAEVEMRLWSAPNTSIHGTVDRVAPMAEEQEFGRVVRVLVRVPNEDGKLAANLTGHAKISAGELPVWQVFTRIIVRFFEVELWSWLP